MCIIFAIDGFLSNCGLQQMRQLATCCILVNVWYCHPCVAYLVYHICNTVAILPRPSPISKIHANYLGLSYARSHMWYAKIFVASVRPLC